MLTGSMENDIKEARLRLAPLQTGVGNLYYDGNGVNQDYNEAIKYYQKAVEQGNAPRRVQWDGVTTVAME